MAIYIFDEDGEIPTSLANGGGVATNRNAIGPLTATISSNATLGDRYEVHSVEPEDFTVAFPPNQRYRHGDTQAASVTLHGGGSAIVTKTTPGTWTGQLSGNYTLNT